jgi:hypothetical protein
LCIFGYLFIGFFSGMFFAAISRAKPPKKSGEDDYRAGDCALMALVWPIAFPWHLVTNIGRVLRIVFGSYERLLIHVHGKTHKEHLRIRGTG